MNWKSVICPVAALLVVAAFSAAGAVDQNPRENPHAYRLSLHPDYSIRTALETSPIPSVFPSDHGFSVDKASSSQEILISESVGPANFTQEKAGIADLKGGRMAAVWEDDRQGTVGVFLQILDNNGNPIGANAALIVGPDYDLSDPHVCADTGGNFYVVWRKEIGGMLQAARFDSLGGLVTPVFFVSDTTLGGYAGEFDAVCLPDKRLVVAWEDYALGNNVVFRIMGQSGAPSTSVTRANSDGLDVRHWVPSVTASSGGDFAVVWEDYRGGEADVYFRRFNALGSAYSAELSLGDASAPDSARYLPSVAYSKTDGYIAAWVDLRDGQNIYMQRLGLTGALVGTNVLLTDQTSGFDNWEIDLGVTSTGNLLAAWTLYGSENAILLQRFLTGFQKDGLPVTISNLTTSLRFDPAVAGNEPGNAVLVWTDLGIGSIDVFGAVCDGSGTVIKSPSRINDDAVGSPSIEPDIAAYTRYDWTIVFTDMRRDAGDIMLQGLYVGGDLVGVNRMINADALGGHQSQPAVAAGNEKLLICWTDVRGSGAINGQNIVCRFSKPHYDLTPEIVANNDSLGSAPHYTPATAVNRTGKSMVVWTDGRSGIPHVYGQVFDQNNVKQGTNVLIGPSSPSQTGETPIISADSSGNFIIGYLNRLNPAGPSVEFVKVTAAEQMTNLFTFASNVSEYEIDGFDAAVRGDDRICLGWHGFKAGETQIFMTVFTYAGAISFASTAVTDAAGAMPGMPDLSVDNLGHVLIAWIDHRLSPARPFRQIFDPTMVPMGGNQQVASDQGRFMQQPAVAGYRGRALFAWADARANGLNIYASTELYQPTDADVPDGILPTAFDLEQNYPNPFNPTTTIRFSLARAGHVRLDVFNLLGERVRTLTDADFPAGAHGVVWDGTDDDGRPMASGIYLYRLRSDNESHSRKMSLVK